MQPLTGGVSSDVVRVDLRSGPVCIKRALPRLRVEKAWHVSVERNAYEVSWLRAVHDISPQAVPAVLGEDREAGFFVMTYLPPDRFPVWKAQLRDGQVEPHTARAVGMLLQRIHSSTAGDRSMERVFAGAAPLFHALRLEPYFLAAALANPDCSDALQALVERTAATRVTLVHGDCSPKNILIGPEGPVLLDAEASCFGDPAFDLAFCLSHLLLKCFWVPSLRRRYLECFDVLAGSYLEGVSWESREALEARAACLLPALVLGRVDGKSPVEYLVRDSDKAVIRAFAITAVRNPGASLGEIRESWPEPT